MNKSVTTALLHIETKIMGLKANNTNIKKNELFISINPDLKSDFGHYLNYERRLEHICHLKGIDYICFANLDVKVKHESILPVFEKDSGYFASVRKSTSGHEPKEFQNILINTIKKLELANKYIRIHCFFYCGSSRLAFELTKLNWPFNFTLTVNSFWDFLAPEQTPNNLCAIKLQHWIKLLAMSDLQAEQWHAETGLYFDWIPNPSPLLDDYDSYMAIRSQMGDINTNPSKRILFPGLMTIGKGKESTKELLNYLELYGTTDYKFIFRDRNNDFSAIRHKNIHFITGDLSDADIIKLYRSCDIVVLPYEEDIFKMRTSGAFVDALFFGAVPLVMKNTWLSNQCQLLNAGLIIPDMNHKTILNSIADIYTCLKKYRSRSIRAAAAYLHSNSWDRLFSTAIRQHYYNTKNTNKGNNYTEVNSLLSSSNIMMRDKMYDEASYIYNWLKNSTPLNIYSMNMDICRILKGNSTDSNGLN